MDKLTEEILVIAYYIFTVPCCCYTIMLYNLNNNIVKKVRKRIENSKFLSCKIS